MEVAAVRSLGLDLTSSAASDAASNPASNLIRGSSVATDRDASQPPRRDSVQQQQQQLQLMETAPNGVRVNGVDYRSTASPPAISSVSAAPVPTSAPESVSPTPGSLPQDPSIPTTQPQASPLQSATHSSAAQSPSAQPLAVRLPQAQSSRVQSPSAQPLAVRLPQAQSSRVQSPQVLPQGPQPAVARPIMAQPVATQLQAQVHSSSSTPHSQSPYHYSPPLQQSRVSSQDFAPPSSQVIQPQRQPRDMDGVPTRFPSPDADHASAVPRFNRDLSLLADSIQQACPEAVRRVVRDKWDKCIVGSEFHHAFVLNAIIHHASGAIMRRAIRDFGQKMTSEAKHEIASHLKPNDLDDIAAVLLEKCSDDFLDKALEQRLKTIDARSLINALARAERLGYENGDIIEDRKEHVRPGLADGNSTPSAPSVRSQPPPVAPVRPSMSQPIQYASPTELQCRLCWRKFDQRKTYEYHVQKQLCMKAASGTHNYGFWCEDCGAGFTTKVGQQYHIANAVCGVHATAPATPRPDVAAASKHTQQAQRPPPLVLSASSTPSRPNPTLVETPSSAGDEPYRHLTLKKRAELQEELRQAELTYAPRFREAETIPDPIARKSKLESLHNSFSTKQSIIRKRYGVKLRARRTRTQIEEERFRMGRKHDQSSPGPTAETPSAKRQKNGDAFGHTGSTLYTSRGPQQQPQAPMPPSAYHLPVSQMNNTGLGGSTATAATTDPTAPQFEQQPPSSSLSSLQRKGYRVSSHVGSAVQRPTDDPGQHRGSASAPVVLDDSSGSDDSDGDEEIPATLPPKKA